VKRGAKRERTLLYGICWNFLTDGRKLKELKIVNYGSSLLI
jgi:hypothetical protein